MGARGALSRLIRQGGLYALGNVSTKAGGLVLAVFYLDPQYLSVEGYGYFALLMVTAQLGMFVVGLGMEQGMLKFMTDAAHEQDRASLPFTAYVATAGVATVVFVLLWQLDASLATLLLGDNTRQFLIRLLALYIVLKVVGKIPLMLVRVHERAGLYASAVAAEMVVLLGGVYYFLVVQRLGLEGLVGGYVVSAAVSTVVLSIGMLVKVRWAYKQALIVPLMRYGMPLVIAGLSSWVLNAGDRYLLKLFVTAETVGLYDWAARISGVLNVFLVQSFQLAFAVIGLKHLGAGDMTLHRRTFRHYVIWAGWAVLALSLLAFDLNTLLVDVFGAAAHYLDSTPLVFPMALGFMSYGAYIVVNNVLYATGHTRIIGVNVFLAALLNVVLNLALIPLMGAFGAALATFLAYTGLALMTSRVAEQKIRVGYAWRVFAGVVLLVLGLYGAGYLTASWSTLSRLLARGAILSAYPPLLVLFGFYTWEEVQQGKQWLASRWQTLRNR